MLMMRGDAGVEEGILMMVMVTRMMIMMMTMTMIMMMRMVMETMTFFHTRHVAMSRKMRASPQLPNGGCERRGHCPGKR